MCVGVGGVGEGAKGRGADGGQGCRVRNGCKLSAHRLSSSVRCCGKRKRLAFSAAVLSQAPCVVAISDG